MGPPDLVPLGSVLGLQGFKGLGSRGLGVKGLGFRGYKV